MELIDRKQDLMDLASLIAENSNCISRKVGIIIVKHDNILVSGYNHVHTDLPACTELNCCPPSDRGCKESLYPSRAVHAEVAAIAEASKQGIILKGATAFITLQPCLSCLKLLVSVGIKEIFYKEEFLSKNNEFAYHEWAKLIKVEKI